MIAHANVENVCLRILRAKGWELSVEGEYDEAGIGIDPQTLVNEAQRGEFRLAAHNPIKLLGLAAVHAYVQPESAETGWWWAVEGPDIRDELWERVFENPDETPVGGDE